jgi:hypothetical protein
MNNLVDFSFRLVYSTFLFLLLSGANVDTAWSQPPASDVVNQVVNYYVEGRFKEAEVMALRTLQYAEDLADVERAELHRLLGFTYVALGEEEKAKRQFVSWLEIDSLASLDPLYISPKIRRVFDEAHEEFMLRKTQQEPPDYTEINRQVTAAKRSLIFPGLGQIYRGQQVKGYSLLASEIVLLGTFAYCQFNVVRARDRYLSETDPALMQSRYDDYNLYYYGRNTSALLALGVYVYSLLDALYFPPAPSSQQKGLTLHVSPDMENILSVRFTLPL